MLDQCAMQLSGLENVVENGLYQQVCCIPIPFSEFSIIILHIPKVAFPIVTWKVEIKFPSPRRFLKKTWCAQMANACTEENEKNPNKRTTQGGENSRFIIIFESIHNPPFVAEGKIKSLENLMFKAIWSIGSVNTSPSVFSPLRLKEARVALLRLSCFASARSHCALLRHTLMVVFFESAFVAFNV